MRCDYKQDKQEMGFFFPERCEYFLPSESGAVRVCRLRSYCSSSSGSCSKYIYWSPFIHFSYVPTLFPVSLDRLYIHRIRTVSISFGEIWEREKDKEEKGWTEAFHRIGPSSSPTIPPTQVENLSSCSMQACENKIRRSSAKANQLPVTGSTCFLPFPSKFNLSTGIIYL